MADPHKKVLDRALGLGLYAILIAVYGMVVIALIATVWPLGLLAIGFGIYLLVGFTWTDRERTTLISGQGTFRKD